MIFAASTMLLFAACNKEENNGYTINGDQITFGMGMGEFQDEGKQSFNGEYKRIYFTTGDQILVNATAYGVYPQASSVAGTSSEFSPLASVTATASADGRYDFMYPAGIFTVNEGTYTAFFPQHIQALAGNAVDNNIDNIAANRRPIWPMYFGVANIDNFSGRVILKNAAAFLSPSFIYGPAWANVVLAPLTGAQYGTIDGTNYACPTLNVVDGVIKSNQKLWGNATLNYSNISSPKMEMVETLSGNARDVLYFDCPANTTVVEGSSSNNQEMTNVCGIIPVAPMMNNDTKTFQVRVALYVDVPINNVNTRVFICYTSSENEVEEFQVKRARRYMMPINIQTVGDDFDNSYTYVGGSAQYATNVAGNGAVINFYNDQNQVNSTVFVTTNITSFNTYVAANPM